MPRQPRLRRDFSRVGTPTPAVAAPLRVRIRAFRIGDPAEAFALGKRTPGAGLGESDRRCDVAIFLRRSRGLSLVATDGGRVVATILCRHDGRRG